MTQYIVATIDIADRAEYARYEAGFMEVFSKYDGTVLAVDESPTTLEGTWPHTRTVLISFPSDEAVHAWYHSEEYQAIARHRLAASVGNIAVLAGF